MTDAETVRFAAFVLIRPALTNSDAPTSAVIWLVIVSWPMSLSRYRRFIEWT